MLAARELFFAALALFLEHQGVLEVILWLSMDLESSAGLAVDLLF